MGGSVTSIPLNVVNNSTTPSTSETSTTTTDSPEEDLQITGLEIMTNYPVHFPGFNLIGTTSPVRVSICGHHGCCNTNILDNQSGNDFAAGSLSVFDSSVTMGDCYQAHLGKLEILTVFLDGSDAWYCWYVNVTFSGVKRTCYVDGWLGNNFLGFNITAPSRDCNFY